MGGSDDHTISKPLLLSTVVGENGVGDHRGWRVAEILLNHDCYPSRGKYLKPAGQCWFGEAVGVLAHEQGAGNVFGLPVFADGLADGQNVVFVEAIFQR